MTIRSLCPLFVSASLLVGCGVLPDISLGEDFGIPPVSGSTTINVPQDYKCGDPISDPEGKYTVESSGDATKCTFTFRQDVVAIKAEDYSSRPELEGAQAVNGIDIDVDKFDIRDPSTGERPTGLLDLQGQAFGVTILTEDDLDRPPPFTKSVEGAPVEALKSQIQAKQDIVIPVDVVVVVALDPAPPAQIHLDFEAQPNITIGF